MTFEEMQRLDVLRGKYEVISNVTAWRELKLTVKYLRPYTIVPCVVYTTTCSIGLLESSKPDGLRELQQSGLT